MIKSNICKKAGAILVASIIMLTAASCSSGGKESAQLEPTKEGQTAKIKAPEKGEQIATITIKDFGVLKAKFFPKSAPKAVENFVKHAKDGYYDGLTFHRVINQFMIQGGDPEGTGMGGESIWGEGFGPETTDKLHHFSGALAMAQSSLPNSIGSQYYIVNSAPIDPNSQAGASLAGITDEKLKKQYEELGGAPFLDGDYTVFGQVYEGLEAVQKVMDTELNGESPVNPVIVESIVISEAK